MITLHAGDNLQHALDTALPGETIQLEPGATWVGNFTTAYPRTICGNPNLGGSAPLTADALATIRSPNSLPALATFGNDEGWRFSGLCFAVAASQGDIVRLGDGVATNSAQLPRDLVFDHCLFAADQTAKNGLQMNALAVTLRRCSITGVKLHGVESHAIVTYNSPGPFLVEDCYLEAGSCGVLVGGAKAAIPNLVPADFTFRRNTVTRPIAMRGGGWAVKNLFELKNAKRVVCTGNVFQNNWPDSQSGWAIVLTVRANSPSAPWSTIQDVLFESNIVRHAAMGCNILGLDDQRDSAGVVYQSTPMDRVILRNNLWYDLDAANWGGNGCFLNLGGAPRNLTVERNTVIQSGSIVSVNGPPLDGFAFNDNIALHNTYGIFGDGVGTGTPAIARYFPGGVIGGNVLAGGKPSLYPSGQGNGFPTVSWLMENFTDSAAANFRVLGGYPGYGCDQDALDAAAREPVPPAQPTLAETITTLAAAQLDARYAIGGEVSPQEAAYTAVSAYRDALLAALEPTP